MAADIERRLKESTDASLFRRMLDNTNAQLDQQLKANLLLAETVEQQEQQLADLGVELGRANSELAKLQESETMLRHRADAAEASAQAKFDLIALLHEIGIRPSGDIVAKVVTGVDDVSSVLPLPSNADGRTATAEDAATWRRAAGQVDLEDFIATGRTDPQPTD